MRLKTYIVDDDDKDYIRLSKILAKEDNMLELTGNYLGKYPYEEAIRFIQEHRPHVIFIDYELKEGTQKTGRHLFDEHTGYPNHYTYTAATSIRKFI